LHVLLNEWPAAVTSEQDAWYDVDVRFSGTGHKTVAIKHGKTGSVVP
jgi:hypothetical protein